MIKILFVLPDLRVGGTCTSFNVLYKNILSEYDISVLPISQYNDVEIGFADKIIRSNRLISHYYANSKLLKGPNKWLCILIKLVGRLLFSVGFDFEELLFRCQRRKIIGYDIIVAYQEGYVTNFCSKLEAKKKIAWVHCDYNSYLPKSMDESSIYSRFHKIVCVSEFTSSVFKTRYPLLSSRVICIYNLFDFSRVVRLSKENDDDILRVKGQFNIISVGRIAAVKCFEEIPCIANELRNKNVDFSWFIIGPDCDPPTTQALLDEIKKYHVEDCVKWLGGKSNPYPLFKQADLCVCLSKSEACPMIFMEANILGVPVVSTDFGSSYEFIKQNSNGLISSRKEIGKNIYSIYINLLEWKKKALLEDPECYNKTIINKIHHLFMNDSF